MSEKIIQVVATCLLVMACSRLAVQGGSSDCKTIGGKQVGLPCKFPFRFKGKKQWQCITANADKPWCATEVYPNNETMIPGKWGNCGSSCPRAAYIGHSACASICRANALGVEELYYTCKESQLKDGCPTGRCSCGNVECYDCDCQLASICLNDVGSDGQAFEGHQMSQYNELCSDIGLTEVTDANECRSATQKLALVFGGSETESNWPTGCYRSGDVYWNNNTNRDLHSYTGKIVQRICRVPVTCVDGKKNGDETGIDCGGDKCPMCGNCNDGIRNGDETGIDCGGSKCYACGGLEIRTNALEKRSDMCTCAIDSPKDVCCGVVQKYPDMIPGKTWGGTNDEDKNQWTKYDCDNVVGGQSMSNCLEFLDPATTSTTTPAPSRQVDVCQDSGDAPMDPRFKQVYTCSDSKTNPDLCKNAWFYLSCWKSCGKCGKVCMDDDSRCPGFHITDCAGSFFTPIDGWQMNCCICGGGTWADGGGDVCENKDGSRGNGTEQGNCVSGAVCFSYGCIPEWQPWEETTQRSACSTEEHPVGHRSECQSLCDSDGACVGFVYRYIDDLSWYEYLDSRDVGSGLEVPFQIGANGCKLCKGNHFDWTRPAHKIYDSDSDYLFYRKLEYQLSQKGWLCSDTGLIEVVDAAECRYAALKFFQKSVFHGEHYSASRPTGCYNMDTDNGDVFWNNNPKGMRNNDMEQVCRSNGCLKDAVSIGDGKTQGNCKHGYVCNYDGKCYQGTPYEKVLDGYICSNVHAEIPSPPECEQAAKSLGLVWKGEFYGSGTNNFPACLYSAATKTVLFNKNPRPERNVNLNPKYAAICKKAFELTGGWIQEATSDQDKLDGLCRIRYDAKIYCEFTTSNGTKSTNAFVVNGLEVVNADNLQLYGTYNGVDTIRWLRSGRFYTYWQRAVRGIYIMDEGGANCPLADVIATDKECRTAANQLHTIHLQVIYTGSFTSNKRPAGCYVYLPSNTILFNTLTNPSETSPENRAAGVCKRDVCVNLDNGRTDKFGYSCSFYDKYPGQCGSDDDADFKANELCCSCGA